MRRVVSLTCLTIAMLIASTPLVAQQDGAPVSADDVNAAIDKAARFIKQQQKDDGTWPDRILYAGGLTPLCTLALLHAGCGVDDPAVAKALHWLRGFEPTTTYAASLQTMVFCLATPEQDRVLILRNVRWLNGRQIKSGDKSGMWAVPTDGTPDHTDNSMTHFALLALHEAERLGIASSDDTWRMALGYWQRSQNGDGSWGWGPGYPGTGSMTAAGIAAILMASDRLAAGDVAVDGDAVNCCSEAKPNAALPSGLEWLARHFSVQRNPGADYWLTYYLYSLERAGRLTAQRWIGTHDWYREGAQWLVRRQLLSGAWPNDLDLSEHKPDPAVSASFALMFLAKGRRPVVLAQVRPRGNDEAPSYRRALVNLVGHLEQDWRKELTYQAVDLRAATVEDLLETPILFLRGRNLPPFTAAEKQKLRMYVDRGGFLWAEQCCGGGDFDAVFRRLMSELFPEEGSALRLLPPEHPIWFAEEPVEASQVRELWGINVACRTGVVYSPDDLSCYWELARLGTEATYSPAVMARVKAARAVGLNVAAYATNREVKYKNPAQPTPPSQVQTDAIARGKLYVANVIHPGGCRAAPTALQNLLRLADEKRSARIGSEAREVGLTDPALFDYHLLFLHGRTAFQLTPAERQNLRLYLERGGMIFADAICSSTAFSDSLRAELKRILPDARLEAIPADDPLFTTTYGGDDATVVELRRPEQLGPQRGIRSTVQRVPPQFEGIRFGERWAVVFSPFDVSCALESQEPIECAGYTRKDAARLALNVLMYSLH